VLFSSFCVYSFHSSTLLQATLALSLVISPLKSACCDFSIFSAMMPRSPAPLLTWSEFCRTLTIFCNHGPKVQERIHLLQLLILNCGMLCHHSPVPCSCQRWWVGCIYGWLGLSDPPAPVVLPLKWPTRWCHHLSEGSWVFALQSVAYLIIHQGSPSSPTPLGCWTSTEKIHNLVKLLS